MFTWPAWLRFWRRAPCACGNPHLFPKFPEFPKIEFPGAATVYSYRCGECDFQVAGPDLPLIRREFYRHAEFQHVVMMREPRRTEIIKRYRLWAT